MERTFRTLTGDTGRRSSKPNYLYNAKNNAPVEARIDSYHSRKRVSTLLDPTKTISTSSGSIELSIHLPRKNTAV